MSESSHQSGATNEITSIREVLPDRHTDDSLLVYGPAMSGQHGVGLELLETVVETGGKPIYVTTTDSAVKARTTLETALPADTTEEAVIIDCVDSDRESPSRHLSVQSPGDLEGIAVALSAVYRDLQRSKRLGSRVLIDSLSPMLLHADLDRVSRFLHPLLSRVESEEGLVIATMDTDGLEPVEVETIRGLFDSRIRMRSGEDPGVAFRLDDADSDAWYTLASQDRGVDR